MPLPRAPDRLSDDMAAAIGHAVSGFGFLEEALKRAIFSLTRKDMGEDAPDHELERWLKRMEAIADDTMGTLIDAFTAELRAAEIADGERLAPELAEIRTLRNLLCHASWRPGGAPGLWHPTFINTRGERYPDDMGVEDIRAVHERTLKTARRVVSIMRQTGIEGEWAGDPDDDDD